MSNAPPAGQSFRLGLSTRACVVRLFLQGQGVVKGPFKRRQLVRLPGRRLDTDPLAADSMSSKVHSSGGTRAAGWKRVGALFPYNPLQGRPGVAILASPPKGKDHRPSGQERQPLPEANAEAIDFLNSLREPRQGRGDRVWEEARGQARTVPTSVSSVLLELKWAQGLLADVGGMRGGEGSSAPAPADGSGEAAGGRRDKL
ncbi:Hypothetical predicted protein [Marmota monax]|uniref:Uncharacterized protein n=1 Tax=Marmota monax TaxID=9995 RepID=A0A5E4AYI1_MARMO|nr:hypothetical protein GHT09_018617 [Marmota monax]VTJ61589.1 Hypothetical predicted protein [Marmota monax]